MHPRLRFAAWRWRSSAISRARRCCCAERLESSVRKTSWRGHAVSLRKQKSRSSARDLKWPGKRLDAARATLEAHGDRVNAAHARYVEVRRLLLIGRLDDADRLLDALEPASLPYALRTVHELIVAGIAMRRVRAKAARSALTRAERAARNARIPALEAEVATARRAYDAPAAKRVANGNERLLPLEDVERLFASDALVVDACRHVVRSEGRIVSLATRPVLFALARTLGEAWPGDASRGDLITRVFRTRHADESHRARLRVEIGRLRRMLQTIAGVSATGRGFALVPRREREIVVLARPVEEKYAAILALLADGEPWSSSALSLAVGSSQRTVQRTLDSLAAEGKVQAYGRGRSRRWTTPPLPGFTTSLLLPPPLPRD